MRGTNLSGGSVHSVSMDIHSDPDNSKPYLCTVSIHFDKVAML